MNYLTFILSTGRCGTQWIADALRRHYSDDIEVTHEPLHDRYEARRMLGIAQDPSAELPEAVTAHVATLAALNRPYIECGHPCWSFIPYLLHRFPQRIRIVHLLRHPVPTCLSWLTHGAYEPPLLPHLVEKVLLSPADKGVRFPAWQQRWDTLDRFGKCLYYWCEVNALGLAMQEISKVPWLTIKYEALFAGDALGDLLAFLALPSRDGVFEARNRPQDRYRYVTSATHDWRTIADHADVVGIARAFGYDVLDVDASALHRRYVEGGG